MAPVLAEESAKAPAAPDEAVAVEALVWIGSAAADMGDREPQD